MKAFQDTEKLASFLQLNSKQKKALLKSASFALKIPLRLAKKIQKQTLNDPILRQFIPMQEEMSVKKGYVCDPLKENKLKQGALLWKYRKRALLFCSSSCAMHCRYCFRRNTAITAPENFKKELAIIAKEKKLQEIVLSGGDPLSLSDKKLSELLFALQEIKHIKRIRIHSRYLIGYPERISKNLLSIFSKIKKRLIFVIHVNHPLEIDAEVQEALHKLSMLGIPLLNQSVLLKGVNDKLIILQELYEKLIDSGVIPYYLHQLDKVAGASHFAISIAKGRQLMRALSKELPGYGVPKYVVDKNSKSSKTLINF